MRTTVEGNRNQRRKESLRAQKNKHGYKNDKLTKINKNNFILQTDSGLSCIRFKNL